MFTHQQSSRSAVQSESQDKKNNTLSPLSGRLHSRKLFPPFHCERFIYSLMMDVSLVLALLAVILTGIEGHTLHLGRTCPEIPAFPNLSVDKLLGTWYVIHKFDTGNTCLMWDISRGKLPDTLLVTETRQLSVLDVFGVDHTHAITANVEIPNPEVPSRMRIRWPTSALTGKADFVVFDTDYDNYVAIFECDRAGFLHRRSATILSREPTISDLFVKRVRRLLDTADVSHSALSTISHSSCRISGRHNWHVDEELFGLLPGVDEAEVRRRISDGVQDYDITQLEIVGDGVSEGGSFRGSLRDGRPAL